MNREDANSWNVGLEEDRGAILDSFSQKQICKKYVFNLNIKKFWGCFFFFLHWEAVIKVTYLFQLYVYFMYLALKEMLFLPQLNHLTSENLLLFYNNR